MQLMHFFEKLESPVEIVTTFDCYNLNPQRFESLIHGFLANQRLAITLTSKQGEIYHPREWFAVPLDTAIEVVKRIVDGTIAQYRIDNVTGRLKQKQNQNES